MPAALVAACREGLMEHAFANVCQSFFVLFHQFDENMEAPQSEEVTTRCNKCGVQCSKTDILRGAAYSIE